MWEVMQMLSLLKWSNWFFQVEGEGRRRVKFSLSLSLGESEESQSDCNLPGHNLVNLFLDWVSLY